MNIRLIRTRSQRAVGATGVGDHLVADRAVGHRVDGSGAGEWVGRRSGRVLGDGGPGRAKQGHQRGAEQRATVATAAVRAVDET